jgi:hypothetical protein
LGLPITFEADQYLGTEGREDREEAENQQRLSPFSTRVLTTTNDSRRLKHCRLPPLALFATFRSNAFSGSIAIPGPLYRIQRLPLTAGFLPSADCSTAINGHEAIRQDLDLESVAPLCHELDVALVIFVTEKRLLPAVSSLRDVMRKARCDNTC